MKHLSKFFVVALLVLGFNNLQAQDENNPWQVSFGVNAIDVYPTNDNSTSTNLPAYETGSLFNEYFNVNDHWNIIPSVSYIGVSRYIGDGFSVGARGSLNRIENLGDVAIDDVSHYAIGDVAVDDVSLYSIDGTIKYNILKTQLSFLLLKSVVVILGLMK